MLPGSSGSSQSVSDHPFAGRRRGRHHAEERQDIEGADPGQDLATAKSGDYRRSRKIVAQARRFAASRPSGSRRHFARLRGLRRRLGASRVVTWKQKPWHRGCRRQRRNGRGPARREGWKGLAAPASAVPAGRVMISAHASSANDLHAGQERRPPGGGFRAPRAAGWVATSTSSRVATHRHPEP